MSRGQPRVKLCHGVFVPGRAGRRVGMRSRAPRQVAGLPLVNFDDRILVALVKGVFLVDVHIRQSVGVGQHTFEGFAAERNERCTKIRKGVVATATADDVGRSPKLPRLGLVAAGIEMFRKGLHFSRRELAQFFSQQLALGIHVAICVAMDFCNHAPEFVERHSCATNGPLRVGSIIRGCFEASIEVLWHGCRVHVPDRAEASLQPGKDAVDDSKQLRFQHLRPWQGTTGDCVV